MFGIFMSLASLSCKGFQQILFKRLTNQTKLTSMHRKICSNILSTTQDESKEHEWSQNNQKKVHSPDSHHQTWHEICPKKQANKFCVRRNIYLIISKIEIRY